MKRLNKLIVLAILLTVASAAVSVVFLVPGNSAAPKIWTDRSDYPPMSIVTIYGNNFLPNTAVTVNVTWPDGSLHILNNIWTDSNGNFNATHTIGVQKITYNVTATDGTNTARTKFTDSTLGVDGYGMAAGHLMSCTSYITTQSTSDVLYVFAVSDYYSPTISDGAGLSWNLRQSWAGYFWDMSQFAQIYCYWAYSSGKLTNDYVRVSGSWYSNWAMAVIAVSGVANPSSPFDSNAACNAKNVDTSSAPTSTPTVSTSISGSNDLVLSFATTIASSHTITQVSGTLIGSINSQTPSCAAEKQTLSSGTYATTFSLDSSDYWIAVTDAFNGPPSYSVTFNQSGLGSDASGTVVTINSTTKTYSLLPNITTVTSGDSLTFSYAATVSSTQGKQYVLTGVNATSPLSTISSSMTVTGTYKTQYYLTVSGGNAPSGQGWYDSGGTTTASSNWIYGTSGSTRTALTNWQLDTVNQNPSRSNTGNLTTSTITMSTYHTVNFVSTTQYYLNVAGGNSITFGTASPTSDQWYDSGGSTTVSSYGVWSRSGGSGQRAKSWNLDGGSNTALSSTGTVATSSVSMTTYHTVNFNAVTQYQVTLDTGATNALSSITSPAVSSDYYWYDSGTTVTVTLNGVYSRSGGSGIRISGYQLNGGSNNPESTTGTFNAFNSAISNHEYVTTTIVTQYQVTLDTGATNALSSITLPTITSDNYWYDTGTTVSIVLNGVYGRGSGTGTRLTNYYLNGGSANPVSTTSTVTVFNAAISNHEYVTTSTATQYQVTLDSGATSALYSITSPTISGDNYWYDSSTSVTLVLNGVYGRSGGSGSRVTGYKINAGTNNPESTTGTFTVLNAISISGVQAITTTIATQYQVTLDSTAASALNSITSPTVSSDNYWYDSTTSVTVVLNGVWGRSGGSGNRLMGYVLNGGSNNPTSTTGTVTVFFGTISNHEFVTSTSVTQYFLTVSGGYGVTYGTSSTISDDTGWYDSGSSTTVSSNGVWSRTGGSGIRLSSWNLDGGSNTAVATTGTVTTSSVSMTNYHTVNFNSVTQYQVNLDSGATSALSSLTSPTISGDNYWYDSGTSVTLILNGVYGRGSGTGTRVTGYQINSGSSNSETTAGTFTVLNALSISSAQSITTTTVSQYLVSLDSGATAALSSITAPTVSGDTGWYDSGTSVTYTGLGVFSRSSGTGTRSTSWYWDSNTATPVSTVSTFSSSAMSMSASHTIHVTTVTQYQVTLDSGATAALSSITAPTVSGDTGWYDSATSVTYTGLGVFGRPSAAMRSTSWYWDSNTATSLSTVSPFSSSAMSMGAPHTIHVTTVSQYQVTLDSGATAALNTITSSTVSGDTYWYDSGTAVTLTLHGVYGRSGGSGTRVTGYKINGGSNNAESTTGTFTVLSAISISSSQAITTTTVTQYQVTLDSTSTSALNSITSPTVSSDDYWYDTGSSVSVSLNGVWNRGSGTGNRLTSYSLNGGGANPTSTIGTVTVVSGAISSHEFVTATSATQYFLTVNGGDSVSYGTPSTIGGDTGWYDSGTSTTVSSSWVWGASGGSRFALTNWQLDGIDKDPSRSNTGTLTTASVAMSADHTVTFVSTDQYQLTDTTIADSESSVTPSQTSDGWYDSGTAVSVVLNNVWGASSTTRTNLYSYTVDSSTTTVTRAASGTVLVSITMSAAHSVTDASRTQYLLTVNGGNGVTYGTASPTNDNWYDSTQSTTVSSSWVWGTSGGTRSAVSNWNLDGGANQNPTRQSTGALTTSSVSMSAAHTVNFVTVTQYYLTVNGGNGISVSGSQTGDQWFDSGTSGTATSNYVWNSNGQSRNNLYRYNLDGGSWNTITRANTGTYTTPSITMSTYHTVNFGDTVQYYLTVTGGNSIGFGTASPTSDQWYDTGTSTTVSSDWVWNTVPSESRSAITNYALDSIDQGPTREYAGTLTTSSVTMSAHHTVAFASATQYYLTVSSTYGNPTGEGWYDGGSSANFGVTTPDSSEAGTRSVFTGWSSIDSGGYTGSEASHSVTMNNPITETAAWKTQYLLTVKTSGLPSPYSTSVSVDGSPVEDDYGVSTINDASSDGWRKWFDASPSSTGSIGVDSPVAGATGTRYAFNDWTDGPDVNPHATLALTGPVTLTVEYKTQFKVSFTETGLDSDASGTVVTIGENAKTYIDLPVTDMWLDSGTTYSYESIVSAGADKQYLRTGVTGPASPIVASGTVNGAYKTQWSVTFSKSGLGSDASGTVLSVSSPSNSYTYSTFPSSAVWVDDGATYTFTDPIGAGSGKQYALTGTPTGVASPVHGTGSVSATYKTQWQVTFSKSGVDSDAGSSTILTVGSTQYTYSTFPSGAIWVDDSSAYSFASTVSVSGGTKQYALTGTSGGLATPITASGSESGSYKTQWSVTFDQSGVSSDAGSNTVLTVGTTDYGQGSLPLSSVWVDDGTTFSYASTVAVSGGTKQYAWTSNTGGLTSPVHAAGTVTGQYKTQWQVAFSKSGVDSDAGSSTILTVGSTTYTYSMFPSSAIWVDDGTAYSYSSTVSAGSGKQYALTGTSGGLDSPISASGSESGSYKTQWQVTFEQTGVGSDAGSNTVLTLGSTDYGQDSLPQTSIWVDDGTTFSFAGTVAAGSGKQYVATGASGGLTSPVHSSDSITENYKTQYHVTFAATGGSTGPSGTNVWEDAGPLGITATPDPGYSFTSWGTSGSITVDYPSLSSATATIDGTGTITATFTQQTYTISVTVFPTAAGSVNANKPGPYHYGDVVKLTESPAVGFSFLSWMGDGSGTGTTRTVTVTGDMAVTANFGPAVYVVPENTVSALLAFAACFAGFGVFYERENLRKLKKNISLRVKQAQRGSSS
ncbi:MAG: hypothetical protein ABSD73_05815 [Candidatus Bathyarchaeia archaeon]